MYTFLTTHGAQDRAAGARLRRGGAGGQQKQRAPAANRAAPVRLATPQDGTGAAAMQ